MIRMAELKGDTEQAKAKAGYEIRLRGASANRAWAMEAVIAFESQAHVAALWKLAVIGNPELRRTLQDVGEILNRDGLAADVPAELSAKLRQHISHMAKKDSLIAGMVAGLLQDGGWTARDWLSEDGRITLDTRYIIGLKLAAADVAAPGATARLVQQKNLKLGAAEKVWEQLKAGLMREMPDEKDLLEFQESEDTTYLTSVRRLRDMRAVMDKNLKRVTLFVEGRGTQPGIDGLSL